MSQKKPDFQLRFKTSQKLDIHRKSRDEKSLQKKKKTNEQNGRHLSKNRPDALLLHGIQHIYTNLGRNNEVDSLHLQLHMGIDVCRLLVGRFVAPPAFSGTSSRLA